MWEQTEELIFTDSVGESLKTGFEFAFIVLHSLGCLKHPPFVQILYQFGSALI